MLEAKQYFTIHSDDGEPWRFCLSPGNLVLSNVDGTHVIILGDCPFADNKWSVEHQSESATVITIACTKPIEKAYLVKKTLAIVHTDLSCLIFNIDVDDAIMSPIYTVENATISLAAENMSHFVVVNVASTVQNDEEKMCLLICAESTRICSELVCKKNYEPQILNGQFAARSSMI